MTCNPPYARGVTGHWDKCEFPGVLKQDCYDYINFDFNCVTQDQKPCGTSTSSGENKDAFDIYTFPSYAGIITFTYEAYGVADSFKVQDSNGKVYVDTGPVSGGKTITFCKEAGVTAISVSVKANPSGGTRWDYSISCPVPDNNCPGDDCLTESGSFSAGLADCQRIDNVHVVTNNFRVPALLTVFGGANDEVIINGDIYQPGIYPFNWSSYNVCGSVDGDNGSHGYSYEKLLQPGNSVTFGGKDNGYGGEVGGSWVLKTLPCLSKSFIQTDSYKSILATENTKIQSEPILSTQATSCNITAQIRTTGCCLEFESSTGRMYAVGDGVIFAGVISGFCSSCSSFALVINNQVSTAFVSDGEYLVIYPQGKCKCTKTNTTPEGFNPGPCYKGFLQPYRLLKNTETGVYQIELNPNLGKNSCGCG